MAELAALWVLGFQVVSDIRRHGDQDRMQVETYMGIRFPVPGVA